MPNNVRALRVEKGLTMRDLADKMGIHFTTIAKIERSERRLSLDWIDRFSKALGVAPEAIIGDPGMPAVRLVPLVGRIAAGNWREAIETPEGMVPAVGGGPNSFALRPDGDSMDKVVQAGDYVVVDPDDSALRDGLIYAIQDEEGGSTLKRFRADPPRLEPDSTNPEHKAMLLGAFPIRVLGRICWLGRQM